MNFLKTYFFFFLVIFCVASQAIGADLQKGFDAYQQGDYATALKEWKPLAEQGDSDAQYNLWLMYYHGKGVPQDYKEAAKWSRKSAVRGNAGAQYNLGWMFGKGEGVTQDYKEAVKWYTKAAEQGQANAQYNLGNLYYNGEGVTQDDKEAFKWFTKAAEQGHVDAQYSLGWMYYNGEGVTQDYKEAFKWCTKAAKQELAEAQNSLARLYYNGEGVTQNYKEAAKWYTKAAEQGHAGAQCNLGWLYYDGKGVPQDYKEAAKWYTKAAEQGHAEAQYNLGEMYYDGKGVLQNKIMAYALWSLASIEGDESSMKKRDRIAKKLSKQELTQGRKIAEELQQRIEPSDFFSTTIPKKEMSKPELKFIGSGTAFITSKNGYLMTCYHIIKDASKISISINYKEYPAKLLRVDKHNDIALLKIDGRFSALSFAPRNSVKMGSDVFTIGYPNPILQGVNQKLTEGNINAITGYQDDIRLYQISTPVQPGNSGGALLNKNGDVVGIIVAVLKTETAFKITGSLPQNVNYALKSTYIQALIDTVPEATAGLQKPHRKKSFDDVVERVRKSVVRVLAYK